MKEMSRDALKVGVMGGSFDPIHLGHISLAVDALEKTDLEKVVIVPARIQPFKQDAHPASGEDRINMLKAAFRDFPEIEVSEFELEQEGISYTYLTLAAMQEKYGADARIYFICGTASLLKLHTWKNSDELLDRYSYIVGNRPGYRDEELALEIDRLRRLYGTEILKINNRLHDVSSTEIRQLIRDGKAIDHLVGSEVEEYIKEHGLYRQ